MDRYSCRNPLRWTYVTDLAQGLYLHRLKPGVDAILRRGGYMQDIGEDHEFAKKQHAIATIFPKLNHSICKTCERRIFRECATIPGPGDSD